MSALEVTPEERAATFEAGYAPDSAARAHPDASPLRGAPLSGLPAAVILTAEHDVLRDEGELYATLLMRAGVPVRHRRFDGQMHGFLALDGVLPGAWDGLDFIAAAIADHLASSPGQDGLTLAAKVTAGERQ